MEMLFLSLTMEVLTVHGGVLRRDQAWSYGAGKWTFLTHFLVQPLLRAKSGFLAPFLPNFFSAK